MKTAAAVLAVGALVGIGYLVFLAAAPSVKSGAPQELTAAAVPSLSAPPLNPRQTDEVIAALISGHTILERPGRYRSYETQPDERGNCCS